MSWTPPVRVMLSWAVSPTASSRAGTIGASACSPMLVRPFAAPRWELARWANVARSWPSSSRSARKKHLRSRSRLASASFIYIRRTSPMFVPHSFALALLMMITSAVCWGSWANTYKGVKSYRLELHFATAGACGHARRRCTLRGDRRRARRQSLRPPFRHKPLRLQEKHHHLHRLGRLDGTLGALRHARYDARQHARPIQCWGVPHSRRTAFLLPLEYLFHEEAACR